MTSARIKACHLASKHKMSDMRIFEKECKALARNGFDVTLIGFGEKAEEQTIDGVRCISLYCPIKNNLETLTKRNKMTLEAALKADADIYHIHEPELLPVGKKLKKAGKTVIFDSHEFYGWQLRDNIHKIKIIHVPASLMRLIGKLYMAYETRICKRLDAVIQVCTMNGQDYFRNRCRRTLFIRNLPGITDYTRKKPISFNSPVSISMIGGITKERGVTQLVKAAALTGSRLNLAGKFSPASYENELRQMSEYQNVDYRGFLDKNGMVALLEETSIGASTLLNIGQYDKIDTFPTKVYDYMAMELPVIISNTRYAMEMNDKYHFGICVDPSSPEEIAQAVQWIEGHPEEALQMGKNGRKIIENEWNWEQESLKLVAFYHQLLQTRQP